jgi:hypothetical protein
MQTPNHAPPIFNPSPQRVALRAFGRYTAFSSLAIPDDKSIDKHSAVVLKYETLEPLEVILRCVILKEEQSFDASREGVGCHCASDTACSAMSNERSEARVDEA